MRKVVQEMAFTGPFSTFNSLFFQTFQPGPFSTISPGVFSLHFCLDRFRTQWKNHTSRKKTLMNGWTLGYVQHGITIHLLQACGQKPLEHLGGKYEIALQWIKFKHHQSGISKNILIKNFSCLSDLKS